MHNFIKLLCTCFLALWISVVNAQGSKKDSLIQALEKATQDTSKIKLLLSLSFDLRASDPQKALKYASSALKLSKKISDKKKEARSHNNMGLAYFYQSNYDSAIAHYESSLKIGIAISDSSAISLAYSQLGNAYKALSNFPLSIEYHKKALKIRQKMNDTTLVVQSYSNLGNSYTKNFQYDLAINNYFRVLEILSNKPNSKEYINTLGGIGNIYASEKNFKKAIYYYLKCYLFYVEHDDVRGLHTAALNLGDTYKFLGKNDSAIFYIKQSIKINERLKNQLNLAEGYSAISRVYAITEQLYESKKYLQKAFEIYSELGLIVESSRTALDLSKVYLLSNDKVNGNFYLSEGLKYIDSINNPGIISNSFRTAAYCYHLLGDNSKAYDYLGQSIVVDDSLQASNGVQMMAQMQSAFDLKLKENEIESLNREKRLSDSKIDQQQAVILYLIIGSLLFIILVFFVFRGYRKAKEANHALSIANGQINEKSKNISDSINYAKNIQSALLTVPKNFEEQFKDNHFILYKPKDVVSGDFYWIDYHDRHLLIVAADCTGHGVPGSMMSMLGFEKLKQAVHEKMLILPNKILSFTNKSFIETFSTHESTGFIRDGMDAALCTFNLVKRELLFSGANRPLWIVTTNEQGDKEIKVLHPTKAAIGGFTEKEQLFELQNYSTQKGDIIYLFTDGYADQFGGKENKKFMIKRFRELLLSIATLSMSEQKEKIDTTFAEWKADNEQVDDVLVIAFRIP